MIFQMPRFSSFKCHLESVVFFLYYYFLYYSIHTQTLHTRLHLPSIPTPYTILSLPFSSSVTPPLRLLFPHGCPSWLSLLSSPTLYSPSLPLLSPDLPFHNLHFPPLPSHLLPFRPLHSPSPFVPSTTRSYQGQTCVSMILERDNGHISQMLSAKFCEILGVTLQLSKMLNAFADAGNWIW